MTNFFIRIEPQMKDQPEAKPIAFGALSEEQFNELMERGFSDYSEGKYTDSKMLRAEMHKEFGT